MGYWNHRVTKEVVNGETQYAIREIYYGMAHAAGIGWTADPSAPTGETKEELKEELERMLAALSFPTIDITDEDNPKEET